LPTSAWRSSRAAKILPRATRTPPTAPSLVSIRRSPLWTA
jgi:hypothetical protein